MDDIQLILDRIAEQVGRPLPDFVDLDSDAQQYLRSDKNSDEEKRLYLAAILETILERERAELAKIQKLFSPDFFHPLFGRYSTAEWLPVVFSIARLRDAAIDARYMATKTESETFQRILEGDVRLIKDFVFQAIDRGDGQSLRALGDILDSNPGERLTQKQRLWQNAGAAAAFFVIYQVVSTKKFPTKRAVKEFVERETGIDYSKAAWSRLWKTMGIADVLPHESSATDGLVKVRSASFKKRSES